MLKYGLLALSAALLALVLTPWVRALALRLGAVDEPGGRHVHAGRVPRLGGLAVLLAFLGALASGVFVDWTFAEVFWGHGWGWGWLLAGALVITTAGILDDIWSLGPIVKLGFQLTAGVLALAGACSIHTISNPLTGNSIELGWLAVPLTLLWVVGITNAFNLIDGLDGLAAGVALIVSATLFVVSLAAERVDIALLSITLAGALAGFLYYNFNPATIFLGDSGSLLLGYLLAVLSIQSAQKGATTVVILVPILALGLPIMDTLLAMLRRVLGALRVVRVDRERNEYHFLLVGSASVFRADREHIHHRLMAMGLTHRRTVLLLYGVCAALSTMAFLAVTTNGPDTALLVAIVGVSTFIGIRKLGYHEVAVLRRGTLLPLFEIPVVNRRLFHALIDACFTAAAYTLAFKVASAGQLDFGSRSYLLHTLAAVVAAKLAVFLYSGVYRRTYRYTNTADLIELMKGLVAAEVAAAGLLALLYGPPAHAGTILVLDLYFTATMVVGARLAFKLLEVIARGQGAIEARPVLIYGAGTAGTTLLREIAQNPALGYRAIGFVDDHPTLWGRQVNGVPVLGGSNHLREVLSRSGASEVVVASPKIPAARIQQTASICALYGVHLRRFRIALDDLPTVPTSPYAAPTRPTALSPSPHQQAAGSQRPAALARASRG